MFIKEVVSIKIIGKAICPILRLFWTSQANTPFASCHDCKPITIHADFPLFLTFKQ